jgi:flagellin-like hook-associated protein FlgL
MSNTVNLTASVRSNLLTLKSTASTLQTTTERLSTGKKVASAIDNPTNYFAAQTYTSNATSLTTRLDSMSEATQQINAADNGITQITSYLSQMEGVVNNALSNTDSDKRVALGKQYNEMIVQIKSMASDSGYGGINLLSGNASSTIQFGVNSGDSTLKLQGFNISAASGDVSNGEVGSSGVADSGSAYALTVDANGSDIVGVKSAGSNHAGTAGGNWEVNWGATDYQTTLNSTLTDIESFQSSLDTQSSQLANNLSIITTRETFTDKKINILNDGASNLTSADLNTEGANLLSLQTSQSLAVQSLSLSSSSASNVLTLIRG